MSTRVRFHLANGPNKYRWQVRTGDDVSYYDPEDVILEMKNAVLRNQRGTAERILNGENKTVCAWVECDRVVAIPKGEDAAPRPESLCQYNPKRRANWFDEFNADIDNNRYPMLITFGRLIIQPQTIEV